MALKKETAAKIAAILKIEPSALEAAIKATDEVDVDIPEGLNAYSDDELATLKRNEYNNGKKASVEMEVKAAREKYGLDFTGKTLDGLMEAYKGAVLKEAQVEPTKQVETLQAQVKKLQDTVTEQENKLSEATTTATKVKIDAQIRKHIPAGLPVDEDEFLASMSSKGITWAADDSGNVVFSRNGQPMQDKLAKPLAAKDVITAYQTERGWTAAPASTTAPGGRGTEGGAPVLPKAASMSELTKQFEEAKKSIQGQEFAAAVAQHVKENPEFKLEG